MRKYIGTKLVEAEPAWRTETGKIVPGAVVECAEAARAGYRVRYTDGYESWSPKAVFEQAYLPLEHNRALKTDEPSISAKMVEDFILETWTETIGEKTTVVRAVLRNGFEIVESSSCVSPENYDEAMGRDICLKKIRDKVWMLLGFLLQTAVDGCAVRPEAVGQEAGPQGAAPEAERKGVGFGEALEAMKAGKKCRRAGWNGKNQHIELATRISYMTAGGVYMNVEHEAIGNKAIAFVGTSGVQMGWLASQADMLAEDWEIVEQGGKGMGDMTVNASALLIQAVEEAKNASKARMGRDYCSWHEAWAKLLEQKESAEKEKKALDTLHKELWGAITEKDEDRARMELWQIANNALQMAMCYALLAAEAGRATDELA